MMIALAKVADRGPLNAALLAAGLVVAGLWMPVILMAANAGLFVLAVPIAMASLIASAAVVSFVALRHGESATLRVIGSCFLILLVLSAILYGSAVYVPFTTAVIWLPAIVAAVVLARTVRLDHAVLTVAICAVIPVIIFGVITGDTSAFWLNMVDQAGVSAAQLDASGEPIARTKEEEEMAELVKLMASNVTRSLGVSIMIVGLMALFLARSWQAGLFNPGGFQKEFHALSFGRNIAIACALVVLVAFSIQGQVTAAIAMVGIFAFSIQGLAVVHALVAQRGMHRYWLNGTYALLIVPLLPTWPLLAALGLADNMVALRQTDED